MRAHGFGRRASRNILAVGSALALAGGLAACGSDDEGGDAASGGGGGGDTTIGLITKTDTNPFFVKRKEGAQAKAKELGIELQSFAGKKDGDRVAHPRGQVRAHVARVAQDAGHGGDADPRHARDVLHRRATTRVGHRCAPAPGNVATRATVALRWTESEAARLHIWT